MTKLDAENNEEQPKTTRGKPFAKGQSGNPGGRPREVSDIRELARERTPEAFETLYQVMCDPASPANAKITAANSILDRGYGKPMQAMELTGRDGADLMPKTVSRTDEEILDMYLVNYKKKDQQ